MKHLFFFISICLFFSCSLKYTEDEPEISGVPELVFSDSNYYSYEDGVLYSQMKADLLEQYHEETTMYGRQVTFKTYDKEGGVSAEGSCDLISSNTSSDYYMLLGDVKITSYQENISINGDSLKWNGRTEQLVSGAGETIYIEKGQDANKTSELTKMDVSGSDFSASGLSGSFQFLGPVSGKIHLQQNETQEVVK